MKVLLQRVSEASVTVDGACAARIGSGLLLLTGIAQGDTREVLRPMAEKIAVLRIFPDGQGRFHRSLIDVEGAALAVPQFTLFADTSKGRRPEFFNAMKPPAAAELFNAFCDELQAAGVHTVKRGIFGAHMNVALVNDGPVTLMLESP